IEGMTSISELGRVRGRGPIDPAARIGARSAVASRASLDYKAFMFAGARETYEATLREIRDAGLYKDERVIVTPQAARIGVGTGADRRDVLNFCANNYLGLSSHPRVIEAAHEAIDGRGFGMSSVRFICGTQDLHKELEAKISAFFGTEDTILYSSCF